MILQLNKMASCGLPYGVGADGSLASHRIARDFQEKIQKREKTMKAMQYDYSGDTYDVYLVCTDCLGETRGYSFLIVKGENESEYDVCRGVIDLIPYARTIFSDFSISLWPTIEPGYTIDVVRKVDDEGREYFEGKSYYDFEPGFEAHVKAHKPMAVMYC